MRYSKALGIIREHQESPPIPVIRIAHQLGAKVYKAKNWPSTTSGKVCRNNKKGGSGGYVIYTNAKHPEVRRRFTIAHEIAHMVLHPDLIGDGIRDDALYRSELSGTVEAQANRLAADILMPWHLVNAAVEDGADSVDELAAIFKVSKSAMSIRLGVPYEGISESDALP